MNRRRLEIAFGVVVLIFTTVMATGPSYVLGASTGGVCADCDGGNVLECKSTSGASSGCQSTEIVSECTGGGELDGLCKDDEDHPPNDDCRNGCGVENEYCEDDESLW